MKDINSALRSHRKPSKTEFYQLIVVVNFEWTISYQWLIENRLIVNIPNSHFDNGAALLPIASVSQQQERGDS